VILQECSLDDHVLILPLSADQKAKWPRLQFVYQRDYNHISRIVYQRDYNHISRIVYQRDYIHISHFLQYERCDYNHVDRQYEHD
jgi:hypothetical protein